MIYECARLLLSLANNEQKISLFFMTHKKWNIDVKFTVNTLLLFSLNFINEEMYHCWVVFGFVLIHSITYVFHTKRRKRSTFNAQNSLIGIFFKSLRALKTLFLFHWYAIRYVKHLFAYYFFLLLSFVCFVW